jgi:hypothetical protein
LREIAGTNTHGERAYSYQGVYAKRMAANSFLEPESIKSKEGGIAAFD